MLYRALVEDRESLLGALVAFGSVITIEPGMGALAFCAVVILAMFARSASIARARRIARPSARSHFSGAPGRAGVPPAGG